MNTQSTLKHINSKVRISGNVIEIFTYENGYFKGYQNSNKVGRASLSTSDEDKSTNRTKTLQRARTNVRNLVNSNPELNKFFTLTFKENVTDIAYANNQFRCFIKRLNRALKKRNKTTIKYIAVIEFQKRGAIHYHMLCNLPYIKTSELQRIWQNGFIKINKIDNVNNVGAYITKYMTKDNDDNRLIGNRSYFTSQGLNESIELTNDNIASEVYHNIMLNDYGIKKEPYSTTFENEYLGKIEYTQIVLEKPFDINALQKQIKP